MTVVNCVSGIPKLVGVGADGDDINRRSGAPVLRDVISRRRRRLLDAEARRSRGSGGGLRDGEFQGEGGSFADSRFDADAPLVVVDDVFARSEADARAANPGLQQYAPAELLPRVLTAARAVRADPGSGKTGREIGAQLQQQRIAAIQQLLAH